jgi:small subunit ribosomal protein S16
MPVKIRLTRMGKKKQPTYRVVVVDSRKPRDGANIEQIGRYDPRHEPSIIEIDNDKALKWLQNGAQPTERARKLLEISGAWSRFRVARGDIHTIADHVPSPPPATSVPEPGAEPVSETPVDSSADLVAEVSQSEPVESAVGESDVESIMAVELDDDSSAAADDENTDEEEQA